MRKMQALSLPNRKWGIKSRWEIWRRRWFERMKKFTRMMISAPRPNTTAVPHSIAIPCHYKFNLTRRTPLGFNLGRTAVFCKLLSALCWQPVAVPFLTHGWALVASCSSLCSCNGSAADLVLSQEAALIWGSPICLPVRSLTGRQISHVHSKSD